MRRLVVVSAAGAATALTGVLAAAVARRLAGGRSEQALWREVTDSV